MEKVLEITSNDHIIMIDKLCKRILGHPEILGRIIKGFIKEAKDVSLEEMDAYMHGNTIPCTLEKGYYALCFQDIPFGFGKCDGQMMKNKIPKGLRLLPNSHVFAERKPI